MTCRNCGGEMAEQIVDICLCEMSPPRKIASVPALVCSRCDARLYSGQTSIRLDDIRERFDVVTDCDEVQTMLVYNYDAPARQRTLLFSYDDTLQMAGITTMSTVASVMGRAAGARTEVPVQVYPGTVDVARREAEAR